MRRPTRSLKRRASRRNWGSCQCGQTGGGRCHSASSLGGGGRTARLVGTVAPSLLAPPRGTSPLWAAGAPLAPLHPAFARPAPWHLRVKSPGLSSLKWPVVPSQFSVQCPPRSGGLVLVREVSDPLPLFLTYDVADPRLASVLSVHRKALLGRKERKQAAVHTVRSA